MGSRGRSEELEGPGFKLCSFGAHVGRLGCHVWWSVGPSVTGGRRGDSKVAFGDNQSVGPRGLPVTPETEPRAGPRALEEAAAWLVPTPGAPLGAVPCTPCSVPFLPPPFPGRAPGVPGWPAEGSQGRLGLGPEMGVSWGRPCVVLAPMAAVDARISGDCRAARGVTVLPAKTEPWSGPCYCTRAPPASWFGDHALQCLGLTPGSVLRNSMRCQESNPG